MEKSGIYKITNPANGKIYIGSALNLILRRKQHFRTLLAGTHRNKYLQRSFDKYGMENFNFDIIEYCNENKLIEKEQYYIDKYHVCEGGYNICPVAGSTLGYIYSEEDRNRIKLSK